MLPSASDRRAWLPLILVMVFLLGVLLLVGVGPTLLSTIGSTLLSTLDAITMVLGITVIIHLVLLPPIYLIRKFVSRLLGLQVV